MFADARGAAGPLGLMMLWMIQAAACGAGEIRQAADETAVIEAGALCGNGAVDIGEECDDGNLDDTDECLGSCTLAYCGDGAVLRGVEQCDDGNLEASDGCSESCRLASVSVNTERPGDQRAPAVALQADGSVVVVWEDHGIPAADGDGSTVRLRRFTAMGVPLDQGEQVGPSTVAGDQLDPDLAISESDQALVVWTDWSSTGGDREGTAIRGRIFDRKLSPGAPDFLVNSTVHGSQTAPAAGAGPGGYWVAFNHPTGDTEGMDIRARRLGADGRPLSEDFVVNTAALGDQMDPDLAISSTGAVMVVWRNLRIWNRLEVAGRTYQMDGAPRSDQQIALNTITDGGQENPRVTAVAAGFAAVWDDLSARGSDTSAHQVRLRRFLETGEALAPEETVNTKINGSQRYPAVGSRGDNLAVVWEDEDPRGMQVRARRYLGEESLDLSDISANAHPSVNPPRPAIAVSHQGTTVVVWEEMSGADGYEIQLRIIPAS